MTEEEGELFQRMGSKIAVQIVRHAMIAGTESGNLANVCTLLESVITGVLLACSSADAVDKLIIDHLTTRLQLVMPELRALYEAELAEDWRLM